MRIAFGVSFREDTAVRAGIMFVPAHGSVECELRRDDKRNRDHLLLVRHGVRNWNVLATLHV